VAVSNVKNQLTEVSKKVLKNQLVVQDQEQSVVSTINFLSLPAKCGNLN
jgi:hypothetical protein